MNTAYMYLTTNSEEKRGHELENVQGGVYGKVWKEEKEGGNDVTVL